MATSENGWNLVPAGSSSLQSIPGLPDNPIVLGGAVATVLAYVARQFNARVELLTSTSSHRPGALIEGTSTYSNHASATAIDLNGGRHPYYVPVAETFTTAQVATIRQILSECAGVIRWGGDFPASRVDGMHFEIYASAELVALAAARLSGTLPPVDQEDDMLALARLSNSPAVYVGNGMTRRHVATSAELADIQSMIRLGVLKGDPEVHVVASIAWLGQEV
jgi:hypothetical protein